jgi:ABC-type multidrug transport system ATPase subunit
MNHTLEVDGVMLNYNQNRVLQNIYLKCSTGKVTGLLGRNGCGKSSLMRIMFGEPLTEDKSVRIDGKGLLGSFRNPKDMRYLPQQNFIPDHLLLSRVMDDFGLDEEPLKENFPELNKLPNMRVYQLSGGWKRILELYIILKSESKFVLLDEPFSHIMPLHVETIKRLIIEEKRNKGILISDHLYNHIMEISDQVYMIKNGRTLLIESTKELHEHGYINL